MNITIVYNKTTGKVLDILQSNVIINNLNEDIDSISCEIDDNLLIITDINETNKQIKFVNTTYSDSILNVPDLLNIIKEKRLDEISMQVEMYIYEHYKSGTQKSLLKLISTGNDTQKQAVTEIFNWIDTVMTYYYSKKDIIKNATTLNELYTELDFTPFNDTKPSYTLEEIYKLT